MFNRKLNSCEVRGGMMEKGFSVKNYRLRWIPAEEMKKFSFIDKDLNGAGFWQYFPARARNELSYHCPTRKIYMAEYSTSFSKAKAEDLASAIGHS